jgi:hypothetical protein
MPTRKADNLTAAYELIVYKMWGHQLSLTYGSSRFITRIVFTIFSTLLTVCLVQIIFEQHVLSEIMFYLFPLISYLKNMSNLKLPIHYIHEVFIFDEEMLINV